MADIVIEIKDSVADTVVKKIEAIGKQGEYAQKQIDGLAKALKDVDAQGIKNLGLIVRELTSAQNALIKQSSEVAKANRDMATSTNQLYKAENDLILSSIKISQEKQKELQAIEATNQSMTKSATVTAGLYIQEAKLDTALEQTSRAMKESEIATNNLRESKRLLGEEDKRAIDRENKRRSQAQTVVNKEKQGVLIEGKINESVSRQALLDAKAVSVLSAATDKQAIAMSKKNGIDERNVELLKQQSINTLIYAERLKQAELRTNQMAQSTQTLNARQQALQSVLTSISTAYRLFIGSIIVSKLTETVDAYTLMGNRLKLVSSSLENASFLQKEMFKLSQETRAPVKELTSSFVRFDYALKGLGATQRESLVFTKTLAKQLQISGLSTTEQSSALLQLSQALNKGKLDGDEFRTVMETLPTVATAIANTMGVARGELIKLAPQGKITSSIIREAVASIASDTDEAFGKLAPTISSAFTTASNSIIQTLGEINKATGISTVFAEGIILISKNLDVLAYSLGVVGIAAVAYYGVTVPAMIAANAAAIASFAAVAAAAAATYFALKSYILSGLDAQDAQTEADNKKADEFERKQAQKLRLLKYETAETISMKKSYSEYLDLVAENNKGVRLGLITRETAAILEQESAIGKLTEKAKEFASFGGKQLTDNQKLEKEINEAKKLGDKYIADLTLTAKAQKEVRDKASQDLAVSLRAEKVSFDKAYSSISPNVNFKTTNDNFRQANIQKNVSIELTKTIEIQNEEYKKTLALIEEVTKAREASILAIKKEKYETQVKTVNKEIDENKDGSFNDEIENIKKIRDERIAVIKEVGLLNGVYKEALIYDEIQVQTAALLAIGKVNDKRNEALEKQLDRDEKIRSSIDKTVEKEIKAQDDIDHAKTKAFIDDIERYQSLYSSLESKLPKNSEILQIKTVSDERARILGDMRDLEISFIDESIANTERGEEEIFNIIERYNKRITLNNKKTAEEIAEAKFKERDAVLGSAKDAFNGLSELAKKREGENSKAGKAAFAAAQALELAQAFNNLYGAISKANNNPTYSKYSEIAIATAIGTQQIANIAKNSIGAYKDGGLIRGAGTGRSDSNTAQVSNGEFIVNADATARNRGALEAINSNTYNTSTQTSNYRGNTIINNYGSDEVETKTNDNGDMEINIYKRVSARLAQEISEGEHAGPTAKAVHGLRKRGF